MGLSLHATIWLETRGLRGPGLQARCGRRRLAASDQSLQTTELGPMGQGSPHVLRLRSS